MHCIQLSGQSGFEQMSRVLSKCREFSADVATLDNDLSLKLWQRPRPSTFINVGLTVIILSPLLCDFARFDISMKQT